jgi:hypothetical protein
MFRDDPIYLCGLYEAKLNVIQSILESTGDTDTIFLNRDTLKLLRNILNQDQTDKEIRAAQKIIANFYGEEKESPPNSSET